MIYLDFFWILFIVALGIVFVFVVLCSGSLWVFVVAHLSHNAIMLILGKLMFDYELLGLLVIVLMVLGAIVCIWVMCLLFEDG